MTIEIRFRFSSDTIFAMCRNLNATRNMHMQFFEECCIRVKRILVEFCKIARLSTEIFYVRHQMVSSSLLTHRLGAVFKDITKKNPKFQGFLCNFLVDGTVPKLL